MDCVKDCSLALNWINNQADKYKFDTTRIVVSGESAGGHLALMTGMAANDSLFKGNQELNKRNLKVAAIVNWFGITDLGKATSFWNYEAYTRQITGTYPDKDEFFRLTSPVTYVNKSTPPVISIHGDKDVNVPIDQSQTLHKLLDGQGIKNKLITIAGKKHGDFSGQEMAMAFAAIWKFMEEIK